MRYVSWSKLRKDDNDNVVGILGTAFKLRPDEEGLSASWLEYFPGDHQEQIYAVVHDLRNSKVKVTPKSGFAIGNVGAILSACNSRNKSKKTRVVYTPSEENKSHVEVMSLSNDDELLDMLASEIWSELILNGDIP